MEREIIFSGVLSETKPYLGVQSLRLRAEKNAHNQCVKSSIEYLNAEDVDYSYGIWVNSVGRQKVYPNMMYPPKEHPQGYYFNVRDGRVLDEYQLVYITDGSGDFYPNKDAEGIKVKGGTLLWVLPGEWHSYCPSARTGWNEYYIGFKGEIIDKLIGQSFLKVRNESLEIGFNEELVNLFMRAVEVAHNKKAFSQPYLSGIVLHMLGLVMSQWQIKDEASTYNVREQQMEQAKIIMRENVYLDMDLRDLAASLNMSYSWFRKLFKDYTGCAPAKYLQNLKIEKVKELLATTNMSVKELLYILNYNTAENFYVASKKYTGYTPMEYRHLVKEEKTAV